MPRPPDIEGDLLQVTAEQAGAPLDLVVLAGNVVVYLTPGTEASMPAHLAGWLAPGGPWSQACAADRHVSLDSYRTWCPAAGLREVAAHSGWDGVPLPAGSADSRPGYAVVVHRR